MQGQTIEGENVSLRAEVERLREHEAASREILGVISQNRSDERPVLDAITQNAIKLCDATGAGLWLSSAAGDIIRLASVAPADNAEFPIGMEAAHEAISPMGRCMRDARTISVADIRDDPYYLDDDPTHIKMIDEVGIRSRLIVPLVENGIAFGCISLIRKEVRSFSDSEVSLIESFAEQAVIAIENVRQFREVRERLDREIATGQILGAISRSRADTTPVFEEILESAARLCCAPMAWLLLLDADRAEFQLAAYHGQTRRALEIGQTWPLTLERKRSGLGQALIDGLTVQDEDLTEAQLYLDGDQNMVQLVDEEGLRTRVSVPLVSEGQSIGAIVLSRREVSRFSEDDIRLADTFAGQAVIAIENVRQFSEVQERLEREKASAEILHLISQSRDDEKLVFDIILENAVRLCQADQATLQLVNEERTRFHLAAGWGLDKTAFPFGQDWPLEGIQPVPEAIRTGQCINITDLKDTGFYREGDPVVTRIVDSEGVRSRLVVPLMQTGTAQGAISISRRHVRPFSESDIRLVETFAAQAMIAIENVRQFKALEELNAELGDRVEEQVGEIERMGKLKRFLPAAVANTVISSGSEKMLSSHRALLGVLFCDIRGFTAFCETAEPEETIEVLQTYHEEMGKLINAHSAGVDHRMGDGIMVLFNDPIPCDDPAGDALRLATAMRARMAQLGKEWKRMGFRLGFGVGVSLGYATVGMVGFEGRSDYTASGTAINIGSRLCEMAEDGEILLSTRAAIAVEEDFPSVSTGEVTLKGIREPVEVFRLIEGSEA